MTKALGQHLATAQPQGNVGKFYGAVSVYIGIRLHLRNPLKSAIVSPLALQSLDSESKSPEKDRPPPSTAREHTLGWQGWWIPRDFAVPVHQQSQRKLLNYLSSEC